MMTMLYKNVSANDGSWNSVLVILISTIVLGQEGPSKLMTTKGIDRVKSTLHDTRNCKNIEHPSCKCSRSLEEAGIHKEARYLGFSWTQKSLFDGAYKHLQYVKKMILFLKRLITDDKKWIVYNNLERSLSPGVMICLKRHQKQTFRGKLCS